MDITLDQIRVDSCHIAAATRLLDACAVERMDVNETAHFARQLEFVKAQTYDIAFGKLKSLEFIPLDTSAPEGAESITYRQWNEVEAAKVVANMADDLPQVNVFAEEFTSLVKSVASSYQWSIQDIRRTAMANSGFDMRLARSARMSIDRRIDQIGATGITAAGTTGLVNNAAVPINTLPNAGAWSGLTALQLLANLHDCAQVIVDQTSEIEQPNAIILPTAEFGIVAVTPMGSGSDTTVLDLFLRTSPYVTQVDQWTLLNTAGSGSVPRIICYDRSPRVLQFNIPLLFESLPPQPRNLAFVVPVHARVGVVEMHYPLALSYSDVS